MSKKTVLSCIQPSGELHLGNYLGAIANWVRLQDDENLRCVYGIVDYHAMSMPYDAAALRRQTEEMILDLLASGLDPEKATLFVQSLVPEHTELYWILSCVCSYGDLTRQTQFKDKSAQMLEANKDDFISSALFTYPALQAADILAYRAHFVPVGKDQDQHLELTRRIVRRFNQQFGEYFVEPGGMATETPKVQSLADPAKKMSKSLGGKHVIGMFEDAESITKKVRSAVTDMGEGGEVSPGVANLINLLRATDRNDAAETFTAAAKDGTIRYSDLKGEVTEGLLELITPMKEKREALDADRAKSLQAVYDGSADARAIAGETLREVRERVGLAAR